MLKDQRPVFPTVFSNYSDRNVTAPDGQPVAPNCTVNMLGMTLRQLYAAHAMQGYLASMAPHVEPVEYSSTIARECWRLADALIATENEPTR